MKRLLGFDDKEFYSILLRLALPITAQYFIGASLYFVDNIMVGLLGPSEAAAITAANSIYSVMNVSCFGLVSGCTIFYSQYWGNKDLGGIRRVMGINLIGVLIVTSTFLIMMQAMPEKVLSLYSSDPVVLEQARQFVTISSLGYIPNMIAYTYGSVLRSCNKVRLPMISSAVALGANTFLNWVLIFGNLGMPKLGLRGSGIATLISTLIDVTIILCVTYGKKLPSAVKISQMRFDRKLFNRVFKRSMPVFLIEFFWATGASLFIMFIGSMGTDSLAAISLWSVTDRLSFVLFIGICNAIAVIIGNKIGSDEEKKAYLYGKRILMIGPVLGVCISALVISLRSVVVSIYNYPAAVQNLGMDYMLIAALAIPFIVYNFFMLVGVLRAGGDTRFCMCIDLGGMYLVSVPLVALAVFVFKIPAQAAFAVYYAGEVIKVFFTTPRFLSKKWIVNVIKPETETLIV